MDTDTEFVKRHERLVRNIALRTKRELQLDCEIDDLIGFGYGGLLEARQRFDPQRGVRFTSFAYYRVRGAVIDGVRAMASLPRRAYERIKAAETLDAQAEVLAEAHARAADGAVPSASRTLNTIEALLARTSTAYAMACMSTAASDGEGGLADDSPGADDRLIDRDEQRRATRMLDDLPPRERALVRGFYFEGRSLEAMARDMGMSKSWASRLHGKALDRMRVALQALPP